MPVNSKVNVVTVTPNSAIALSRSGILYAVNVAPGSANLTVKIWDSKTGANGTLLAVVSATTTGTGSNSLTVGNLEFLVGIYVEFVAGGATGGFVNLYVE